MNITFFFVKCISKDNSIGKIYNLGGGKEVKVNKLANLIGGKKIYIPKRPGEPDRSLASITRAKKELKWKPKINLRLLVKEMVNSELKSLTNND